MSIITERQTIRLEDVTDIQVSEIVAADEGGFTRRVNIFGAGGSQGRPVLELVIVGASREDVSFTTPEIDF